MIDKERKRKKKVWMDMKEAKLGLRVTSSGLPELFFTNFESVTRWPCFRDEFRQNYLSNQIYRLIEFTAQYQRTSFGKNENSFSVKDIGLKNHKYPHPQNIRL